MRHLVNLLIVTSLLIGCHAVNADNSEPTASGGYFIHITDIHVASYYDNTWWTAFIDWVSGLESKPEFLLATGDLVQYPHPANWYALLSPLTASNGIYYADVNFQIPIYFCPGNHDVSDYICPFCSWGLDAYESSLGDHTYCIAMDTQRLQLISTYSGKNSYVTPPLPNPDILTLPEGDGIRPADMTFLQSTLNTYDDSWAKVIMMHHPFINPTSPYGQLDGVFLTNREEFLDECTVHGIDAVFAGHIHDARYGTAGDGIWNKDGEAWREGDGTKFVVTDALNSWCYRKVYLGEPGEISSIGTLEQLKSVLSGYISCLAQVHIYDNYGNHLGPDEAGEIEYGIPGAYYSQLLIDDDTLGVKSTFTRFSFVADDSIDYRIEVTSDSVEPVDIELMSKNVHGSYTAVKYKDVAVVDSTKIIISAEESSPNYVLTVIDSSGVVSTTTPTQWFGNLPPAKPAILIDKDTLFSDTTYTFRITSKDPEGNQVLFRLYWGDSTSSDWVGPFNSGDTCELQHAFSDSGTYKISTSVKDEWGIKGYNSDSLEIIVRYYVNSGDDEEALPTDYWLSQNYPNPFNPETDIRFGLPSVSEVRLDIFNVLGQKVATLVDKKMSAGYHTLTWDAGAHASGIYLYRLHAGDFVESKKMVLIK